MKRILLLNLFLACAFVFQAYAQERTVTGTVISSDDNQGLPAVNIIVKGTTNGTTTDLDGNYTLSVPGNDAVLVFSSIGFENVEVSVGNQSRIDVTLTSDVTQLSEVVVTAQGIQREKRALGYGVSTISSDDISQRPETDVARILRGKTTGVDITQTSGLAGSGTNIIIRGYSSISGSNQPLFVVDGVPFNTDTNSDQNFVAGGATASSRFLDLDPNNIAEISILKGLSATVLYGEAGRNGVVLVTTKTGRGAKGSDKGFEVRFNQDVTFVEVANLPDYQNTYGNGFSGNFGWFFSNWGPSFDVRGSNGIDENGTIAHPYDQAQYNDAFPEFIGQRYEYRPYESVENFFQTGTVYNTSVGLDKKIGDNSSVSINYSYLNDEGFVPDNKNEFTKHSFSLGGRTEFDNGLRLNATFNYVDSDRLAPPAAVGAGSNPSGASLFANLIYTPRSIDLLNLPFQNPIDGSQVYYRRGSAIQNPLWTLNNAGDTEQIRRYFGTINLSYDVTDWLTLGYRVGIDQYTQQQRREVNRGGSQIPDGLLQTSYRLNSITDHLFSITAQTDINENFSVDGTLAFNMRRDVTEGNVSVSTNQFVFDLFTHQNFSVHQNFSGTLEENLLGAYFTGTVGYKDFLYVNVQGRNDWTSTLERENRSVFYPSGSVSFVPTDAFPALSNNKAVDYLKVRVGYGTSAGYPNPYQTRNVLSTATNVFVAPPDGEVVDINSVSNRLGNADLEPELHSELEFGFEASFWESRIGIDLSIYDKQSKDLIIDLSLDPATGFTGTTVNAAEIENKGIELGINLQPIRGAVTWDINVNYTRNRNIVKSIFEGIDQFPIPVPQSLFQGGGSLTFDGVNNYAIAGEPYGVIQGTAYERRDGQRLVGADGNYVPAQDISVIGNPNPDWTGNISNTVAWKGFRFNMLWQYVSGGDIYSITAATMLARGNTVDTDFDRFLPVALPGVRELDNGEIVPNDIQGYIGDLSFRAYFFANEGAIFDATTLRLREASLSYDFPKSITEKTPFGAISIRATGQNLWYKAYNFPEGVNYDPEVLSTGVGNNRGLEFVTGPTSRRYGFGISATF